jgi:hypothetical protein
MTDTAQDVLEDEPKPPRPAWRPNLSSLSALRPPHSRKFAQGSNEWMRACDAAFQAAMLANPSERPK